MMIVRRIFLAAVAVLLVAAGSAGGWAAPPDATKAEEFVRDGLNRAFDVLRREDLSDRQKAEKLDSLLQRYFDVPTIGKFALGRYRRQASDRQMGRYLDAFRNYISHVYIHRIVRYSPPQDAKIEDILTTTGIRPAGSHELFVDTEIGDPEAEPLKISWRVRESDGTLAIIDVEVMGTSQVLTYRQEFASVIRRRSEGIDGLIAELEEKAGSLAPVAKSP